MLLHVITDVLPAIVTTLVLHVALVEPVMSLELLRHYLLADVTLVGSIVTIIVVLRIDNLFVSQKSGALAVLALELNRTEVKTAQHRQPIVIHQVDELT